jgi:large subunit ribosomal protein L24
MAGLNIHRNDTVQVISGSDAGKRGRVLRVMPDKDKVLVEHVHMVKKTVSSKSGKNTKGGIAEQEAPLHVSNVAVFCSTCGKGVRVGYKGEGASKIRVCKTCGNALPTKAK